MNSDDRPDVPPTLPVPTPPPTYTPTQPPMAPPPSEKRGLRNALIALAVVVVMALIGAGAYAAYRATSDTKSADTAAVETKPSESPGPSSTPSSSPTTTPEPSATPPLKQDPAPPTLKSILAAINKKLQPYGVIASVKPTKDPYGYVSWKELTGTGDDVSYLERYGAYLTDEYTKLPTDLVKASGLKKIGIVRDLAVTGTHRAASYVYTEQEMLYDAEQEVNAGEAYARQTTSHEYWHFLDYSLMGTDRPSDPNWAKCNPSGFTYGNGGEAAYTETNFTNTFHPKPGFITNYGTYSMAEDRAETFSWLIYDPSAIKGLGDPKINCKIKVMTKLVQRYSPSMKF